MNDINTKLQTYISELLKWNKRINLIGKSTENFIMEKHVRQSLFLLDYLKEIDKSVIVDIGSGGGFPAIPLAIYLPQKKFILTEVNRKKIAFLKWIVALLKLNANVIYINENVIINGQVVLISRAFSNLDHIIKWKNIHTPEAICGLFLKGNIKTIEKEVALINKQIYYIIPAPEGNIVKIQF